MQPNPIAGITRPVLPSFRVFITSSIPFLRNLRSGDAVRVLWFSHLRNERTVSERTHDNVGLSRDKEAVILVLTVPASILVEKLPWLRAEPANGMCCRRIVSDSGG